MMKQITLKNGILTTLAVLLVNLSSNAQCGGGGNQYGQACPGFRTQTQGGWGGNACGNNPASYLQANFAAAFPSGLTIGCTNKLKLSTSTAVKNFLPSGGTASVLPAGTLNNPTNYSNVFAGQLVAATINVQFDLTFANFGSSATNLKDLVIGSGTFTGLTVAQVLQLANNKIGGCGNVTYTCSQLSSALESINSSYDNGYASGSFLRCPTINVSVVKADVSCFSGSNGSINLTVSGGAAPYTYLWSNGSTSEDLSGIPAGTYSVTIRDHNGQNKLASYTIGQPLTAVTSSVSNSGMLACNGNTNGSIDLTVSGGTAPYSYSWSNGASTQDLSGLGAGTYSVLITDSKGCSTTNSSTISQPAALSAQATSTAVLCNAGSTGSINLTVIGGTSPYTFGWSNSATSEDLTGLSTGNYSVLVTDSKGCSTNASAFVAEPSALTLTASTLPSTYCQCNGFASASASGGVIPYSYSWSNGTVGAASTIDGLCGGDAVSVTVTDYNGCSASYNAGSITYLTGCTGYSVEEYVQGLRNNNTPVEADRSNPSAVLGYPDFNNNPGGFYSLGFGGHITIRLDGGIVDHPGNDLRISETTFNSPNPQGCANYPEKAQIFVSNDNVSWYDLGIICQDGELDIAPLSCILFVKIVDVSNPNAFGNQIVDGYDVDGIQCIASTSGARMAAPVTSNTITVAPAGRQSLNVFPNPAEDRISLSIGGAKEGQALQISIVDVTGREMKSISVTPETSQQMFELTCDGMDAGMYFVQVSGKNFNQTKKFMKK